MKKLVTLLILVILMVSMTATALADPFTEALDNIKKARDAFRPRPVYYLLMTTVIQTNEFDDSVIVVDSYGELWEFEGVEDWFVGDWCQLTMYDSGVPGWRWDDTIVRTIYKGVNPYFE